MAREIIEPDDLIGRGVAGVVIGSHVHDASRSPVQLFLRLTDGVDVQAVPSGDGSLTLWRRTPPDDFDMEQYGSFEFRAADKRHPAASLLDQSIATVERIRWHDTVVGIRLRSERGVVVIANEADRVFVSDGTLPADYSAAVVE